MYKILGCGALLSLLTFGGIATAQSDEYMIGKTVRVSPEFMFCDSSEALRPLMKRRRNQTVPKHLSHCRKFADGALIKIHSVADKFQNSSGEAMVLRVTVSGYGSQYILVGWHPLSTENI